jgi:hypothetical protein
MNSLFQFGNVFIYADYDSEKSFYNYLLIIQQQLQIRNRQPLRGGI